jgi:hypothetical protein
MSTINAINWDFSVRLQVRTDLLTEICRRYHKLFVIYFKVKGMLAMTRYLYKYYPIVEYALESLKNEEICFNTIRAFKDKTEGQFIMKSKRTDPYNLGENLAIRMGNEISDRIIFLYRILCLTCSKDQEYMWEKYAGGKTGFCIEYKCQDLQSISSIMCDIMYGNKKTPNCYFEDSLDNNEFKKEIKNILFKKEIDWDKEKETRIINKVSNDMIREVEISEYLTKKWDVKSTNEYFADFSTRKHFKAPKRIMRKCIPHKIYLGPNILEKNEEQIRRIIQGRQYEAEKLDLKEVRTI